MIICIQNLVKFCPFILKISSKNKILASFKGRNSVANLRKMTLYNPKVDLVKKICIQNLVKFCPFILKIWRKNKILMSIKGRNSVANLRNMRHYNRSVDLVNNKVYTKFGLNLSIYSQDIVRTKTEL